MPNFDTVLLNKQNKTDANPNMTFEHLNTNFHQVRGKHSSLLHLILRRQLLPLGRYRREKGVEVKVHCRT